MEIHVNGLSVNLTLGADPEVFASKHGKLFSAYGLVPGTKENPYAVSKGAIQVDGMALEFNIDPSETRDEFVNNIKTVMSELTKGLPSDVSLAVVPTAEFGHAYIQEQPDVAKELGCSSDLNAYTGQENVKPDAEVPFRTAAGHVHIGWTEGQDINDTTHLETCCELVKLLDLYLGVPSVIIDSDTKRRSLYGAAGAFRSKDYGLEYRVLSNFWLKSEKTMQWVYDQVAKAITDFLGGTRVSEDQSLEVSNVINRSKVARAKSMSKSLRLKVPTYA